MAGKDDVYFLLSSTALMMLGDLIRMTGISR